MNHVSRTDAKRRESIKEQMLRHEAEFQRARTWHELLARADFLRVYSGRFEWKTTSSPI
jgi:hypothetical protein